jgi:hypothetical protein
MGCAVDLYISMTLESKMDVWRFQRLLVCCSVALASRVCLADTIPEIVSHTKQSIIEIGNIDRYGKLSAVGTGFFVSSDGLAVTNYHVIKGASQIIGLNVSGAKYLFERIFFVAPNADLAVLKFFAVDVPYLQLGSSQAAVEGQHILVVGNPNGLQGTVSDGLISAFREDRSYMQITAPISPGSSGSPVLDEEGKVIGVAVSQIVEGQNLNFAIPVEKLTEAWSARKTPAGPEVALSPPTTANEPAPTPNSTSLPAAPPSPTPDLNNFVKQFVTSGNSGPDIEISFYADEVDYFDNGKVAKEFVVEDIKKYNQRWPGRRYWVDGEPKVEMVDSVRDIARAVVTLRFVVQNHQKTIWGSCENVIFIRDASTSPKVMSVRSKFLSRHEKPSSG